MTKMCPIIAKEAVEIPTDEMHGPITKVEITKSQNDEGKVVQYVKATVDTGRKDIKGWNGLMTFSLPAYLSKQSGLGRLLNRLNLPFEVNKPWDEQTLVGLHVVFDTRRDGNFTNVVTDSIVLFQE